MRAVVSLARAMDMTTVAEGVERPEQAELLVAMGCDRAQGYLYSRAVLPEDLVGFLPAVVAS